MPDAAPVPARPMKWPDPMLLANNEAPTCNTRFSTDQHLTGLTNTKFMLREAKKYPPTLLRLDFHDAWMLAGASHES